MTRTITHKHLKRQFNILEETEDLTELFAELQFSTLLLPVSVENNTMGFPMLEMNDKRYAPVFTDIHEFNKCNVEENFTLMPNGIGFYLNLLDEDFDGFIIDVEGERFPLTREIREFINPNTVFSSKPNVLTLDEIKEIRKTIDNTELEEFLSDESNFWDFERLMELLFKSDLFIVVVSLDDLDGKAEDGVIPLKDIGQLPIASTLKFTESYALIYSSESEVKPKNNPVHPYLQFVNLAELINRVLLDDFDGIILNENSQNITISRDFLLTFFKDFNNQNMDKYDDYAFTLDASCI